MMGNVEIKIRLEGGEIPVYHSEGASGLDIASSQEQDVILPPGSRSTIGTGIHLEIPGGFEAQVRPRSGLASRHGITVLNTPGTIDSDYRGEVRVILVNLGEKEFIVKKGDRIAQLVFAPVAHAIFTEEDSLDATARGHGGFGSTGV